MDPKKPTLGYWKIRGLAEGIRLQLAYSGVDYNMKEYIVTRKGDTVDASDWFGQKFTLGLDFPNLPWFKDGDLQITEALAIHQYIAEKWSPALLGKDPEYRGRVNMIGSIVIDLKNPKVTYPMYGSPDKKVIKANIRSIVPTLVKSMGDKQYLAGDDVSWVDFIFYELCQLMEFTIPTFFEEFPTLKPYCDRVANLPKVKEYLASPESYTKTRTYNNITCHQNNALWYKLIYFPLHGRGGPLRALLCHSGIEFEEEIITFEKWPSVKPNYPNGNIPCLQLINGKKMGNTLAILRFLGQRHGYYPKDPLVAQRVDQACEQWADVAPQYVGPGMGNDADARANVFTNVLPNYLKTLDADCAKGAFICGNELTIADFCVGTLYTNYFANPLTYDGDKWQAVLAKFPNFKAYGERFARESEKYLNSPQRGEYAV